MGDSQYSAMILSTEHCLVPDFDQPDNGVAIATITALRSRTETFTVEVVAPMAAANALRAAVTRLGVRGSTVLFERDMLGGVCMLRRPPRDNGVSEVLGVREVTR